MASPLTQTDPGISTLETAGSSLLGGIKNAAVGLFNGIKSIASVPLPTTAPTVNKVGYTASGAPAVYAPVATPPTPTYSPASAPKTAIPVTSAAQTNPAKATPSPTIPSSVVGSTNTLTIPTPVSSNVARNNLGVAVGNVTNGLSQNTTEENPQTDQYGNPPGTTYNQDGSPIAPADNTSVLGVPTGSPARTGVLSAIQNLLGVQATQPQVSEQTYEDAGIYDKMNAANDINNKILTTTRSYQEQAKAIKNNAGGLDVAGVNEQLATNDRQQNEDLANLSIIKSANDNDLQTAQAIADKKLSFQFDPLQKEIDNLGTFVQLNNADLSDSQKQAITVKQYQLQNNLDLLKTAKTSASQYAIQQGITDPLVLSKIDSATTPAEAYAAVEGTGNGSAGLPGGNNIVSGSTGSYDLTGYATDPLKAVKTQNIANVITQTGASSSPDLLQTYISNTFPKSPVTGQMVFDAAQKYGIDPTVLAANMQEESQFGTAGAGAKTNNPNNIGNTDNGSTQTYGSVQQGVEAGAKWLANHEDTGSTDSGQTITPGIQKYVIPQGITGVPGTAYINGDQLSQIGTPLQQQQISRAALAGGVKILSTDDVNKVRSIDVTKQNLQSMEQSINTLLGSGPVGRVGSSISNYLGGVTQSNPTVASFNNYRTLAVNALQALGAGSGGARITAGEIAAATDNLPTIYDSKETATSKINILNGFLNNWTKEILPTAQIGGDSTAQSSANDPLGLGI